MKRKGIIIAIIGLLFLTIALIIRFSQPADDLKPDAKIPYIHNEGKTQGTYYSATYQHPQGIDLQQKIEERMRKFDLSLSTYEPNSIISRINRNDTTVRTDTDFENMYNVARQVSEQSNGAFDITVGPLIKAWGFGLGNTSHIKIPDVSKILPFVGYKKIRLENHKLLKDDKHIMVDANALAQGQSSDIIAKLLETNGCKNFMIEIGGEIVCKGLNAEGQKWRIGIDKPIDDSTSANSELQTIISITDCAVTTSGNYRKYYYLNGKKYAHEINPHTGFPVVRSLLSATVIAPTCIQADAYATAFMVVGVDSSLQICKKIPNMDCYLIYIDKSGKNQVIYTEGFKKYLID